MAIFKANKSFDEVNLDWNWFDRTHVGHRAFKESSDIPGFTKYPSYAVIRGVDGVDPDQAFYAFGENLAVNKAGLLKRGTVNALLRHDSTNDVELFSIKGIRIPARMLGKAMDSRGTLDDRKLLAKMLGGTDVVTLSGEADRFNGYGGRDDISGNAGDDLLKGGGGIETLKVAPGGTAAAVDLQEVAPQVSGDDYGTNKIFEIENLVGGVGDDTLISSSGGYGDQMYGGDGADEFHYLITAGADGIILDFERGGTDLIVIRFGSFDWAGTAPTNFGAWYATSGRGVTVYFDTNGDGTPGADNTQPDYSIAVWGEFNVLDASDFSFI